MTQATQKSILRNQARSRQQKYFIYKCKHHGETEWYTSTGECVAYKSTHGKVKPKPEVYNHCHLDRERVKKTGWMPIEPCITSGGW